ncbi:hypothetical protein [Bacteroides heparinolyticus]|uniref:hypothetical protein n=1 Tax=Prevotella heparinolytica TaxID=28113 RepID=UPI0035A0153F
MKTKIILWIGALLLLTAGAGCEKENHVSCSCECVEEKIPIVTLKNENAHFRYIKRRNDFALEIESKELVRGLYLIPRGCDIPKQYKKDGLPVIISGEVFDCSKYIKPWIRRDPVYFIKLSTIKKKE